MTETTRTSPPAPFAAAPFGIDVIAHSHRVSEDM